MKDDKVIGQNEVSYDEKYQDAYENQLLMTGLMAIMSVVAFASAATEVSAGNSGVAAAKATFGLTMLGGSAAMVHFIRKKVFLPEPV